LILNIYSKPIFMPHGCPPGHEGFISINFSVDDHLHEILFPLKFLHKMFTLPRPALLRASSGSCLYIRGAGVEYLLQSMPSTKSLSTYRRAFNPRLQSTTLWGLVLSIRSFFLWQYHSSLSVSLTQGEDVGGLVQSPVEGLLTTSWATHRSTWTCPLLMSFTGTILAIIKLHYRRNRSLKINH